MSRRVCETWGSPHSCGHSRLGYPAMRSEPAAPPQIPVELQPARPLLKYCPMLDFSRFEIITFDCYGTLIHWEAGILAALHRILAAHSQQVDDATLLKLYADF